MKPNILFLMADQMQGGVFDPRHPCLTPNIDRLSARGTRITRAYTPNPVCSPARASLMTGLLPHNHGVLTVTHTVDDDQSCLRTQHPHWAQKLKESGYESGYFGKWHVEEQQPLSDFGWTTAAEFAHGNVTTPGFSERLKSVQDEDSKNPAYDPSMRLDGSTGYPDNIFYGVTDVPPEQRKMGVITDMAMEYLDGVLESGAPWCCFVSVPEPHDPFIVGREAFGKYDVEQIPLNANVYDELEDRPGIYRKAALVWRHMTDRQRKEAAACYYASITEIDAQFGRLMDRVEAAGQLENTIVVVTSDHGEALGAHGLYCKNFSAFEETYTIPMIVAGPKVAANAVTDSRVGLHDLCPTILELTGSTTISNTDSRSFACVLQDPTTHETDYATGYAEYSGGRMILTQRVVWDGPWKFVFNGFDFDELYNLDDDPDEIHNLIHRPEHQDDLRRMTAFLWRKIRDTGDSSLLNSMYPPLRVAPFGPGILDE